jgi:hypothetical protein
VSTSSKDSSLFKTEKASWLREGGAQELDVEQRAMLLALARLEAALGHDLTEADTEALDALGEQLPGMDQEIARAMHQVVNAPADPSRTMSLSDLEREP